MSRKSKNMEENTPYPIEVRRTKAGAFVKLWEKRWLRWLGFAEADIEGAKPKLNLEVTAKKDTEGKTYLILRNLPIIITETTDTTRTLGT